MTEGTGLKNVLGFRELLSVGIGQTIGSGVMAYTGIAIGITGRGVGLPLRYNKDKSENPLLPRLLRCCKARI